MNSDELNKKLCKGCTKCCEHIAIQIDKPKSKEDFHHIMWYLLHENIKVYIDYDNDWIIEFQTKCKALDNKGLCKVYSTRPNICKEYTQQDCEKHGAGDYYKHMFSNRDELICHIMENTNIKKLF